MAKNSHSDVGEPAPRIASRVASVPAAHAVQLSPVYSRFKETPLRVEVRPGPQTLDFDIP